MPNRKDAIEIQNPSHKAKAAADLVCCWKIILMRQPFGNWSHYESHCPKNGCLVKVTAMTIIVASILAMNLLREIMLSDWLTVLVAIRIPSCLIADLEKATTRSIPGTLLGR